MESSGEMKSKSGADLEEWFLAKLSAPQIPFQELVAVLVFTHDSGSTEPAENLAAILQDTLAERNSVFETLRLLEVRAGWHAGDSSFRETCRKGAAAVLADRLGLAFVKSAGFENSVPVLECIRRLGVMTQLKPGVFCHEKTWGFGVVKKLDEFYNKVTIDFTGTPGHVMSFAYAGETLDLVGDDHIMARKHRDPGALAAMVKNDPAEVVKTAIRSYGPLSAPRLKDFLVPSLMPESEWKGFWDAARKVLKNDPMVDIPSKRNDPIVLLAKKKDYSDEWFAAFSAERDIEKLLALVNELEGSVDIAKLSPEHREKLTERVAFVAKGGGSRQPELVAMALMTAKRLGLMDSSPEWQKRTEELLVPAVFLKTAHALAGRDFGKFLRHVSAIDQPRITEMVIGRIPKFEISALNEAIDYLIETGKQQECAAVLRPLAASRKAGMEIILWLCKHIDLMVAWGVAKPAELLIIVVDAFAVECGYGALKAQNGLRELIDEKGWLEDVLAMLDSRQRHDFLKKVIDAPGFEPASRRSVMARIIKAYPELTPVVAGAPEESSTEKKSHGGRFTSIRSYRARQEALRKLVSEDIPKNSRDIGVARSYGDLRENSEYKFAKEHQRFLMQRQSDMEQDLKDVASSDFAGLPTDKAGVGTCVTICRQDGREESYCILGEWDGDESLHIVSNLSQLAKVLENHVPGDEVILPGSERNEPSKVIGVTGLPESIRQHILG